MRRNGFIVVCLFAATVLLIGSCAKPIHTQAERYVFVATNIDLPYWQEAQAGFLDAANELGVRAQLIGPQGYQPNAELVTFRQAVEEQPTGICLSAARPEIFKEQIDKAIAAGIPVICVDADSPDSKRLAYVGTDNVEGGRELGRCAKLLRPEGGEYVTFVGFTSAQNAKERVQGFAEGAGDKFVQKDNMGDELDRTRAKDNVRTAFTNHPKLNTLVGIWSYNAPAIVGVIEAEKKAERAAKEISIVTFDAEPGAIKKMAEGWIDAMVVQNPYQMGYQGIRLMNALVRKDQKTVDEMLVGKSKEGDLVDTGIKVVVPDSGSPLKPETFTNKEKKIEGYKLSDFQKWLQEFNLTGS